MSTKLIDVAAAAAVFDSICIFNMAAHPYIHICIPVCGVGGELPIKGVADSDFSILLSRILVLSALVGK